MKKLLIVSAIVLGTFASVGSVSALQFAGYPTWAQDAINGGRGQ